MAARFRRRGTLALSGLEDLSARASAYEHDGAWLDRYRLRQGSGGAGLAPGGDGIERDLLMLEDVTVSLITERRVSRPWGLAGGLPGAPGENWVVPGGAESKAQRLLDKCTIRLRAGDVLRILTPGGGGWGSPTADSAHTTE